VPFVSLNHDQPLREDDGLLFNLRINVLANGKPQGLGLGTVVYSRMGQEDFWGGSIGFGTPF